MGFGVFRCALFLMVAKDKKGFGMKEAKRLSIILPVYRGIRKLQFYGLDNGALDIGLTALQETALGRAR